MKQNRTTVALAGAIMALTLIAAIWLALSAFMSFVLLDWTSATSTRAGRASFGLLTAYWMIRFLPIFSETWRSAKPCHPGAGPIAWICCAVGKHHWMASDGHWRRWCRDCGHGAELPPSR